MSGGGGYYLMHRGWLDHPALRDGPFCRRACWADMIEMAAWRPCRRNIGGRTIELQRGEFTASIRFLATRWGVDKGKVERLISRLRTEAMIETRAETGQLIVHICNYDKFQLLPSSPETLDETAYATPPRREQDSSETNKNAGNSGNSLNANSDAYASATAGPLDLKRELFARGRAYLANNGITEKNAGALLGRWRRDHGDGAVIDALARAEAEVAEEPIPFIEKVLRRSNGKQPTGATARAERAREDEHRRRAGIAAGLFGTTD